jgi:hypothetical protein
MPGCVRDGGAVKEDILLGIRHWALGTGKCCHLQDLLGTPNA